MASKESIAEDLKQKKVNYDYLKKNKMDIADLVKMTRKNKLGRSFSEDSDDSGEWIEEVIEDDDGVVVDDSVLTGKKSLTAGGNFQIPKFQPKKVVTAQSPGPVKATYRPPQFPPAAASPKKKEVDGSKMLLLQSAEKKIVEASNAFAEAVKEGEAIVNLLEFMLTNTKWNDEDIEEVDANEWETRKIFTKSLDGAKLVVDRLETAKHTLMGTVPKRGTVGGGLHVEDCGSDTSPHKEADIPAPRPNMGMHREPSFREPSLTKIEEAENSSSSDEEDQQPDKSVSASNTKSRKKDEPIKPIEPKLAGDDGVVPEENDGGLAKAKSEMIKFAQEGAALASKLEKTNVPSTTAKASTERTDDLAQAKSEMMKFAQEGAALVSKLEQSTSSAAKSAESDDLTKAKNEMMKFAQEGAALAAKITAGGDESKQQKGKNEVTESADSNNRNVQILKTKQSFMEATKEGAALVSLMESNLKRRQSDNNEKNDSVADSEELQAVLLEEGSELAKAKAAFLEAAKEGSVLVARLESKMDRLQSTTSIEGEEWIEEIVEDSVGDSAFSDFAKEGEKLTNLMQASVGQSRQNVVDWEKMVESEDSPVEHIESQVKDTVHEEESALAKAKESFLAAAKEGAALVALLEKDVATKRMETTAANEALKRKEATSSENKADEVPRASEASAPTDQSLVANDAPKDDIKKSSEEEETVGAEKDAKSPTASTSVTSSTKTITSATGARFVSTQLSLKKKSAASGTENDDAENDTGNDADNDNGNGDDNDNGNALTKDEKLDEELGRNVNGDSNADEDDTAKRKSEMKVDASDIAALRQNLAVSESVSDDNEEEKTAAAATQKTETNAPETKEATAEESETKEAAPVVNISLKTDATDSNANSSEEEKGEEVNQASKESIERTEEASIPQSEAREPENPLEIKKTKSEEVDC